MCMRGGGNTQKHTRKDSRPVAPLLLLFPVIFFFFLRFISCCKNQEPGTEPPFCSEDERKLDLRSRLWGCFTGFISLWKEKAIRGERSGAQKSRGLPPLFSPLTPTVSPSINLSTYPRLSLHFIFHVLGPCDFAKMHHQQRMAALGTDKELSDLLDFSAVRKFIGFSLLTEWVVWQNELLEEKPNADALFTLIVWVARLVCTFLYPPLSLSTICTKQKKLCIYVTCRKVSAYCWFCNFICVCVRVCAENCDAALVILLSYRCETAIWKCSQHPW